MLGDTALQTWNTILNDNDTQTDTDTTASIALQFQDLFGQDVLYDDSNSRTFYDEVTFEPVNTVEPSSTRNYVDIETPAQKRRRNSCGSSCSSSSSFYSSEEDDGDSFSALNSYRSSDDEQVPTAAQRRQMEHLILDKITHDLDPEKLPGILTIISSSNEDEEAEEVEIDLAQLNMDQLSRILSYVDACLLEKNGGPKVKPFDYAAKRNVPTKASNKSRRRRRRQPSLVDQGHVVDGSSYASSLGPMASIMESDDNDTYLMRKKKRTKKGKHNNNNNNNKQKHRQKEKTASKKSKKKSAIHKRRLLEEMLHPQNIDTDNEDDDETEGGQGIIIFGNEQMDFAVTQNETIAHSIPTKLDDHVIQDQPQQQQLVEEDDEDIDIMM